MNIPGVNVQFPIPEDIRIWPDMTLHQKTNQSIWKLAHGTKVLKVTSSIVNRGSVGRIKKDVNFLLHVVHAYCEHIKYVGLMGGNIEHLQLPVAY